MALSATEIAQLNKAMAANQRAEGGTGLGTVIAALQAGTGSLDMTLNSITGYDADLDLTGKVGSASAGSIISMAGGAGNGAFAGGAATLTGGASGAGVTGNGGAASAAGGAAASTNGDGGAVSATGGLGKGTGAGGAASLTGGVGGATGSGGAIDITGGASAGAGGTAGAVDIDAGAVAGGTGAAVTIGGTNATEVGLGGGSTTLKLNTAELTATAAELNLLDTATAGTAVPSKAAILGADKNLDMLAVADGGLALGAGAGTVITATAAELNLNDNQVAGAVYTIGAEGGNVINVGVQLNDAAAVAMATRSELFGYLSDDANGDSVTATAPDGGISIGTDGLLIPTPNVLTDAIVVDGALAIWTTSEEFQTVQTSAFVLNGVSHTKAPEDSLTFTAAHTVSATKFGCILIQINAAGTISTKVVATPQGYDNAPDALTALPAADANNVALGYIAIAADAGDWVANTDSLTNGVDLTTAAFNDTAEVALGSVPKSFHIVSESDGDIDINITESGVATWYMILVLPNGTLVPSAAITFA